MPEHLRALVYIVFFAILIFHFSKKTFSNVISPQDFKLWKTAWYGTTAIAFLSQNFWLFFAGVTLFLSVIGQRESNKLALFFLLLFVIPPIAETISGFGVLQSFFEISYPRILSLIILLPVFIKSNSFKYGKSPADKFLLLFLLLIVALQFRDTTPTDSIRRGFYLFTDMFLPYYVASRAIKSIDDIKKASIALVIPSLIAALIGMFEYAKHWLIYASIAGGMNSDWKFGGYMDRGGELRAMASLGHPIVFGFLMSISIAFYIAIMPSIKSKKIRITGLIVLIGGLLASLSRGPWMGAIAFVIAFTLTGKSPLKRLGILVSTSVLLIGLTQIIPGGDKYYNLLPFIGKTQSENVEYRQRLFNNSMIVINKSPFFGSINYMSTPEMQSMIQGEHIIDIVNSYIAIALSSGYVGLGLFVSFFLSTLYGLYKNMKAITDKKSDSYLIGRCLLGLLICTIVTITTVSSILIVTFLYTCVVGICVSYIRAIKHENELVKTN